MDIVYLMGEGYSKCENNELRYSLRSIEKYGKNVGKVYVVGYCPEWLSDEVIKVPFKQPYSPFKNIVEKHLNMISTLLYIVDNTDISNEFLVSMDDHFYIREVDFDNYPIYAKLIKNDIQLATNSLNRYGKFILSTKKLLTDLNLPTYYFTLHRNLHVFKDTLNECREIFENILKEKLECEPFVFILNYRYHKQKFKFTPVKDVKITEITQWYKADPTQTEAFSTKDFEENSELNQLIKDLYPDKSKYEKNG